MNKEDKVQNIIKRANRVLEIAKRQSQNEPKVQNRVNNICLHTEGYAEPEYSSEVGLVATGNWNQVSNCNEHGDLLRRISTIFENMGIECEWFDEWCNCSYCNKLIRNCPDSYSWKPSFFYFDGEVTCIECLKKDPVEYLKSLEDNSSVANTIDINPSDFGYVLIDGNKQSGWYPGQNDNPDKIAKELREQGISRFLFNIKLVGQFDCYWSVYLHKDEVQMLNIIDDEDVNDKCNNCHEDCDKCCPSSSPDEDAEHISPILLTLQRSK